MTHSLWDLIEFEAVTQMYYRLFYHMERIGILNPLYNVHLFALHHVYLPRINNAIEMFVRGWNTHPIAKSGGKSPMQLYTEGMLTLSKEGVPALDYHCAKTLLYYTDYTISIIKSIVKSLYLSKIIINQYFTSLFLSLIIRIRSFVDFQNLMNIENKFC